MDFLSEKLSVASEIPSSSKGQCFAADIFAPRPPFENIVASQPLIEELRAQMVISMGRKSCPLASVDLIVDGEGLLGIFTTKFEMILGNAKSILDTVLAALPVEQRKAVQASLRPLDYHDKLRLDAMQTVDNVRPYLEAEEEQEEEEEVSMTWAKSSLGHVPCSK